MTVILRQAQLYTLYICYICELMNEEQEINELKIPLRSNNPFLLFIFREKEIDKISYKPTIACFILASLIFLIISIAFLVAVAKVTDKQIQYYQSGKQTCSAGQGNCSVIFTLQEKMNAPIYVMYSLEGFYQNQRRYVQSKSNTQLLGRQITAQQAKICSPYITNQQMKVTHSWAGILLDPNAVASPCGAIAYTFFNDSFGIFSSYGQQTTITQQSITWPGDLGYKYKQPPNSNQTQWINPENEHFINWMRIGGIPNFKKLWGRIDSNLQAGDYELKVATNFNLSQWSGSKYVVLSTSSSFGGKNYLLGVVLLLLGVFYGVGGTMLLLRSRHYVESMG